MITESQLNQLVQYIVQETLDSMDSMNMQSGMDSNVTGMAGNQSTALQSKMARDKKKSDILALKQKQKKVTTFKKAAKTQQNMNRDQIRQAEKEINFDKQSLNQQPQI